MCPIDVRRDNVKRTTCGEWSVLSCPLPTTREVHGWEQELAHSVHFAERRTEVFDRSECHLTGTVILGLPRELLELFDCKVHLCIGSRERG